MSIFLNKIGLSYFFNYAISVMILGITFPSSSIASFFAVYFVASCTELISNPCNIILNDKIIISMRFRILRGVSATGNILNCGGRFYFTFSHDMILNWFFADFSLDSFLNIYIELGILAYGCRLLCTAYRHFCFCS